MCWQEGIAQGRRINWKRL